MECARAASRYSESMRSLALVMSPLAALAAACSSPSGGGGASGGGGRGIGGPTAAGPPTADAQAAPDPTDPWSGAAEAGPAAGPAGGDGRRWIPGDLHMHVAPFDAREGATLTMADLARRGPAAGLEFVIATPHVHPSTLADPARRRRWNEAWTAMATAARAERGFTIIPGAEYTIHGHGHFGVSGVDLAALPARGFLAAARAAGAFVVVNHPFATPTRIPGVRISDFDLSFRPWTEGGHDGDDETPLLGGVEVWNQPLGLANLVSRGGGQSGEQRAFVAADALARGARRPIAAVGGTDSHGDRMAVTTWVLATDATERALLAALAAGATCVGAIDGGTLVAHGDTDPAGRWARIGDVVRAAAEVELRWVGTARLFVDGVDRGEHAGGFVDRAAAGPHTYRIEIGASRCGFVYANLAA